MPSLVSMMMVALGGAPGSVFRYLLGTLAVNLLGCFLIGFLAQLAEARGAYTS